MEIPRDRYLQDSHFKALVDMMVSHIIQCNYTPTEMRQAAILASIIYEEHTVRQYQEFGIPVEWNGKVSKLTLKKEKQS